MLRTKAPHSDRCCWVSPSQLPRRKQRWHQVFLYQKQELSPLPGGTTRQEDGEEAWRTDKGETALKNKTWHARACKVKRRQISSLERSTDPEPEGSASPELSRTHVFLGAGCLHAFGQAAPGSELAFKPQSYVQRQQKLPHEPRSVHCPAAGAREGWWGDATTLTRLPVEQISTRRGRAWRHGHQGAGSHRGSEEVLIIRRTSSLKQV